MATLTPPDSPSGWTILAVAALVPAPLVAWLLSERQLRVLGDLGGLAVVTLTSLVSAIISIITVGHRARLLGGIGVVTNCCILALYSFLLLFFGLGGSR